MNDKQYRDFVRLKMSPKTSEDPLLNATLGLVGESGEIADHVKKYIFHDHHYLAEEQIMEELGDLMFYVFVMLYALDKTLYEVLEMNMDKLNERYPEGFDPERSMNRG
jgi:NTP pyrophosphatase (non-canonical NTP hydrolase)